MRQPLCWVLVADSGAAKIYRTIGQTGSHRAFLEIVPEASFSRDDPAHFGPRPGKNFSSALRNSGHGVTTHEDLKRHAEENFIENILAWIEKPEHSAAFERLIVVAPARTLGEIRAALSPVLASKVYREIHGDLIKLPIKELEERVQKSMMTLRSDHHQLS